MTIPISPGKAWDTIKELLTGYNRRAQERGERAIAESIPASWATGTVSSGFTVKATARAGRHDKPLLTSAHYKRLIWFTLLLTPAYTSIVKRNDSRHGTYARSQWSPRVFLICG